jgi:protein-S-isoprenylcysteine O-methyltransferase Ste14
LAIIFETILFINYILYRFYPLPTGLPERFPWAYPVSLTLGVLIALPSLGLMFAGMKAAGKESLTPKKETRLFGGIYKKIRHPQAAGEVFGWLWLAFLLDSPFLAVFAGIYFPIFFIMCWMEEQDLLLRFGEAYADYMRTTGAFFPRRPPRQGSD